MVVLFRCFLEEAVGNDEEAASGLPLLSFRFLRMPAASVAIISLGGGLGALCMPNRAMAASCSSMVGSCLCSSSFLASVWGNERASTTKEVCGVRCELVEIVPIVQGAACRKPRTSPFLSFGRSFPLSSLSF